MVGLLLENHNDIGQKQAEIVVEVGFFQNDAIPSLRYHTFSYVSEFAKMDANALKETIEVAEHNINGILCFNEQYDYNCEAQITNNVTIRKFCCNDKTDNPFFVEFPKQEECADYNDDCTLCSCYRKCLYE